MEELKVVYEPTTPKLHVGQHPFNDLSAMFDTETRKKYDWVSFVSAMNEAGFRATHTGGGSVVSFDAAEDSSPEGKINFNNPHP